jgi:hypothetical protein
MSPLLDWDTYKRKSLTLAKSPHPCAASHTHRDRPHAPWSSWSTALPSHSRHGPPFLRALAALAGSSLHAASGSSNCARGAVAGSSTRSFGVLSSRIRMSKTFWYWRRPCSSCPPIQDELSINPDFVSICIQNSNKPSLASPNFVPKLIVSKLNRA